MNGGLGSPPYQIMCRDAKLSKPGGNPSGLLLFPSLVLGSDFRETTLVGMGFILHRYSSMTLLSNADWLIPQET